MTRRTIRRCRTMPTCTPCQWSFTQSTTSAGEVAQMGGRAGWSWSLPLVGFALPPLPLPRPPLTPCPAARGFPYPPPPGHITFPTPLSDHLLPTPPVPPPALPPCVPRYGFHGTSHKYLVQQAAVMMGKNVNDLNCITCHLGVWGGEGLEEVSARCMLYACMGCTCMPYALCACACKGCICVRIQCACTHGYLQASAGACVSACVCVCVQATAAA